MGMWSEEDILNVQKYIDEKFEFHRVELCRAKKLLEDVTHELCTYRVIKKELEYFVQNEVRDFIEKIVDKNMSFYFNIWIDQYSSQKLGSQLEENTFYSSILERLKEKLNLDMASIMLSKDFIGRALKEAHNMKDEYDFYN
jgi:hypothetical protein